MTKEEKRETLKMFAEFPKAIRLAICAGEVFAELKQAAKQEETTTTTV